MEKYPTAPGVTVLHHDRIKKRFGNTRRFIRCDELPASPVHFLNRLSKVVGAEIENPESLTPLRSFLSSKEMIMVLDNAESILNPRGPDARDIYAVVEELSQLKTMCLGITSRVSTVPRCCERPAIPVLSTESARDIFYDVYNNGVQSDITNNLLRELNFHALSRRFAVLRTHSDGLGATTELLLASPTFRKLGPDVRDFLGIVAFFPQGVNGNNADWLFSTVPDRRNIFYEFCALSLTRQTNGFLTVIAPLRDYLCPKDPTSSPLLYTMKEHYFSRLSVNVSPRSPDFGETQRAKSEDVNVEHLLDVFATVDADSDTVWNAYSGFMQHLFLAQKTAGRTGVED